MAPSSRSSLDRRSFLRALGTASTAAAVATVATPGGMGAANAYDPGDRESKARYRADSPDVQAFYRTNGYETLKK
jgi:hypothetical protein